LERNLKFRGADVETFSTNKIALCSFKKMGAIEKIVGIFGRLKESFYKDSLLWLALVFCFGFSLIGAQWGRVEDWNPDQMAFRSVPNNLMVGDYLKPPLTTYAARLIVLNPVDIVMHGILHTEDKLRLQARVLGVRVLTILYLCATVVLIYFLVRRCNGKKAASVIALIMATSAGLVAYTHYGTADIPVVFWMTASFACALYATISARLGFAITAGLLAGLSAACKYNGLGVAIAIPVFFVIKDGPRVFLKKNLWLASIAVPIGFVLGCPGAIFDRTTFTKDFLYNLYVTPVYYGDISHAGYGLFLKEIPNIVGWPVSLLLAGCITISALLLLTKRLKKDEALLLAGALAVFTFYFLTIGRFPRMETRFVLPIVPFVFVAAAPALSRINSRILVSIVALHVLYNLICCAFVGRRFWDPPRMGACYWAEKNFKAGDLIESVHSPSWDLLVPGVKVFHTPKYTGRTARFKKIFAENKVVAQGVGKFDNDPSLEIFTHEALKKRNPDYITFCNFAVSFSGHPQVQQYYKDHIAQKLGYHIVFKDVWWLPPWWAYPRNLDFMTPWMYILKRDDITN